MKRVVLSVVSAALLLAGCSSDSNSAGEPSSASSTPSQQESTRTLTDWAGEVCQARDLLELQVASVALGLDVDPGAGLDQLPELRAQVEGEIEVIQAGVDDLLTVVRSVPEDSPEVSPFVDEVEARVGSAQESANEAIVNCRMRPRRTTPCSPAWLPSKQWPPHSPPTAMPVKPS